MRYKTLILVTIVMVQSAVFYITLYPSSNLLVKIMMGDILMQIVKQNIETVYVRLIE